MIAAGSSAKSTREGHVRNESALIRSIVDLLEPTLGQKKEGLVHAADKKSLDEIVIGVISGNDDTTSCADLMEAASKLATADREPRETIESALRRFWQSALGKSVSHAMEVIGRRRFDVVLASCYAFKNEFFAHFDDEIQMVLDEQGGGKFKFVRRTATRSARLTETFNNVKNACQAAAEAIAKAPGDDGWLPRDQVLGTTQMLALLSQYSHFAENALAKLPVADARSTPQKDLCAFYAHILFKDYSNRIPSNATGGRYVSVAQLLYEFLTGLSEESLENSCKKVIELDKAAMSGDERAFHDTLHNDGKKAFRAMTPESRATFIAEHKSNRFAQRAVEIGLPKAEGVTLMKAHSGDAEALDKLCNLIKQLNEQVVSSRRGRQRKE
jgi:hypothetical protein